MHFRVHCDITVGGGLLGAISSSYAEKLNYQSMQLKKLSVLLEG